MKTQGCPVGLEMSIEVVTQETPELLGFLDVRTRGDQMTTRQVFVEIGIISAIKLVDDHFPDGVASRRTSLGIAVAFVGHAVVQGVRPDGNAAQRSSDGGIVNKELISHHFKLFVTAHTEIRSTDTDHRSVSDVGESFDDEPVSCHFCQPVIVGSLCPVVWVIAIGDGEDTNLMASAMKLLHSRVIAVLVRNVK